ncbi:MAG TPA: hypothetical protein VIW68_13155 [Candidatus Sulfotelmatobacter sp.]
MKPRMLAGALAGLSCLLLFAGSAAAQGGQLVNAEYGLPGSHVDVTARVRSFVRDGVLQFEVNDRNLGFDPAPHQVKELLIRVRHWDGDTKEYLFPEKSVVTLELDPEAGFEWHERGLHIMRAYWGAEGRFVNVTEAVRAHKQEGRVFMRVERTELGADPLPGRRKWLRVLYYFDGERRNVVVEEHGELHLP